MKCIYILSLLILFSACSGKSNQASSSLPIAAPLSKVETNALTEDLKQIKTELEETPILTSEVHHLTAEYVHLTEDEIAVLASFSGEVN